MVAIVGGNSLGLTRTSATVLGANGQLGSAAVGRLGSGVTVNAVTGNLVIQNQDELLTGVGIDAAVMRTYNSLGLMDDDNGDNWRHSGQRKVEVVTAGSVLRLTDWDGSRVDFSWSATFARIDGGTGAYISKAGGGSFDTITYASGIWTFTDGDTLATQTFAEASAGRITGQRDASGNLLSFTYDASNRLTRITTANGEYTELVWNGTQLTQLNTRTAADALTGTKTCYAYDAQGRLATVTIDLSPGDSSIADGKTVGLQYTYDGTSKRVASITETGSGNVVSFTYVQVGSAFRVASVTEAMFSDYLRTTTFSYDTTNRRTTITDALGKVRVVAYDTASNVISITSPADGTGAAPQVVQFSYTGTGDVTSVTDGLGKVTTYTYDGRGNVTESVDPAGNRMRYVYDNKNRLLRKVLVVNTGGLTRLPGTSVDTAYYLATYGDILAAGEAVDPVLHYTVTGWREGRNPNAMFNTNAYLAANTDLAAAGINPLEHWLSTGWSEGRSLGGGLSTAEYIARYVNETTRYAYDSVGRLRFEVTTEGKVTEYRYNSLGQKISTIQYTNNWYPVGSTLASTANVTEAQVAAWVSGLGSTAAIQRTDTTYDYRGNVASEVSYADLNVNRLSNTGFQQGQTGWWNWESAPGMLAGATTGTDAATGKAFAQIAFNGVSSAQYVATYSGNDTGAKVQPGERLAVRVGVGSTGPTTQLILRMQFIGPQNEWLGESPDLTVLGGNVPFGTLMSGFADVPQGAAWGRIIVYALAPAGSSGMTLRITEPKIAQVPAGETVLPAYSPGMIGMQQSAIGAAGFNRVTYTYDQYGQLLAKSTSGTVGSEVYTYDGLGRVLSATDLAGAVTTTAYNDGARTTTVTLANGLTKVSQHDAQGNVWTYTESGAGLPTATETCKYDKLGRLRYHGDALGFKDFTFYDEAGRKSGYMDEKGQLTEFRYDAANRLVATIQYANQVTSAASYVLYLDQPDTPVTITGARPAASNYDRWEWLVYDAADRVVQKIETVRGAWEGQSARVTSYSYDRAGNLDKTVESANVLSPAQVAQLMAQTPGTNLLKNPGFEGTAGWSAWNGQGIINAGSPFAGVWQDQHYLRANFTATAAGQAGSITVDGASNFAVTPGQQLSVKTGVEGVGPVSNLNLVVWWFDANGQPMYNTQVKAVSGQQVYGTQIEGLVGVPTGAASARLEMYMTASGAGSGWFVLIEPKVSVKSSGPALASVAASSTDRITRNFYSKDGQLIGQLDGVGGFVQYAYDRAGRLTRTTRYANVVPSSLWFGGNFSQILGAVGTSAKDRTEYSVYDGAGRVRFRLDAQLRPTEYVYNAAGQVIRTIEYAGPIAPLSSYTLTSVRSQIAQLGLSTNADTRVTRSVYDGAGRLNFTIDALGGVTSLAYDNTTSQVVRTIRYANAYTGTGDPTAAAMWAWTDGNQSAQNAITRSVYDKLGRLVYAVDAEGFITEYQYDLEGQVLKEIRYPGQYSVTDGATVSSVAAQIGGAINDPLTVTKSFAYDAAGQLTDSWDGEGVRTRFEYNAFGQVWRTVSAVGTLDEATNDVLYDTAGRVLDRFGAVGTAEQTNEGFAYDGIGNLTTAVVNNGAATSQTWYGYNANGQRTSQAVRIDQATGANANSTFEYNAFGDLVKSTDPLGAASYSYYDKLGRVTLQIDAEGYATRTDYHAIGTIQAVTRYFSRVSNLGGASNEPSVTVNTHAKDATTQFSYDRLGQVKTTTDAMGFTESFTYDAFGNKVSQTNKLGGVTAYGYDKRGLMVWDRVDQQVWDAEGNPAGSNVRNDYVYDFLGRMTAKTEAANTGAALLTTYAYNRQSLLIERTDPKFLLLDAGPKTAFTYDKRGNVILQTAPGNSRTWYWYDDLNRKIAEVSPVGTVSHFAYDAAGNLLWTKVFENTVPLPASPGGTPPAPGGNFRQTDFAYDARSQLKSTTTQAVTVVQVNGDSLSTETRSLVATNTYDQNGRLIIETDARGGQIYHYYDKLGREIGKVDQERYLTTWERDAEGNVLREVRYANRITANPPVGGSTLPPVPVDTSKDRVTTFTYDKMGRRLSETRERVATTAIGSDGQRHSTTDDATIYYRYNALGQVTAKSEASYGVSDWYIGYNPQGIATDARPLEFNWDNDVGKVHFNATSGGQVVSVAADYRMPLAANAGDKLLVDLGLEGQGAVASQQVTVHFVNAAGASVAAQVGSVNGNVAFGTRLTGLLDIPADTVWIRLEVYAFSSGPGWGSVLIADPKLTIRTPQGDSLNAFGARTDYEYDNQGRMLVQREAAAQDFNAGGAARTRKATYFTYDGLDRVVRTTERAEAPSGGLASGYTTADDRVTRNYYSGDKLHQIIDPVGYARYVWWNVSGQKSHEYYKRTRSDGGMATDGTIYEGTLFEYDAAGRLTTQYQAIQYPDYTWTTVGPVTTFGYNGFGELTGKWVGGRQVEASDYDALGRVIKTNAGDGVWKFFAYDANGNATLTMTTTVGAANQSGQTRDQVLNTLRGGQGSIPLSSLNQSGVTATVVQYDWRNMAIATYEPGRTIADANNAAATTVKTLVRSQSYNAFGELQWELDAIGNAMAEGSLKEDRRAWYEYNTMGRLTRKYNAAITVVGENGQGVWMRPTETYGYDLAGRLVASQNANAGWTTRLLRGGTGMGGGEAQVLTEFRPDGSTQQARYDAFGQLRASIDGIGRQTTQTYDKLGRLATATRATGATDYYEYDILGQRLKYYTSALTTQATQITVWVASGYWGTQTNTTQVWVSSGYNETRTSTWQEWVSSGYWGTQTVNQNVWVSSGYWQYPTVLSIDEPVDPTWIDTSHWETQPVSQTVWIDTSHWETRTGTYTVWVDTSHWETQTTTQPIWIDTSGWQVQSIAGQMLVETTDYDIQGRVIKTKTFGDQVTFNTYAWDSNITTNGLGVFGGWTKSTQHANGMWSGETKDAFGRLVARLDMGGRHYALSYDSAGLLSAQSNSAGLNESFSYYNTGQLASASTAAGTETYTYDAEGNRVRERLVRNGLMVKDAEARYNQLGWLTWWREYGGATSPNATVTTSYDAVGNIRNSQSSYTNLDAYGNWIAGGDGRDYWFRYDAMNRVVLDRGALVGGAIVRAGGVSTSYEYDGAGQRVASIVTATMTQSVRNPFYDPEFRIGSPFVQQGYFGDRKTTYQYNAGGQITAVYVNSQQIEQNLDPNNNWAPILIPLSGLGALTAQFVYDGIGRMVQQNDFGGIAGVTTATYSRTVSYDNAGRITSDSTATAQLRTGTSGYDTYTAANTYTYDALGTLLSQNSKNWKNGNDGDAKDTSSTYGYAWFDAAVQSLVTHDNDTGSNSNTVYTTSYTLDAQGRVTQAAVNDGVPKTVFYTLDTAGQIIRRDERRNSNWGEAAPTEVYYRFGGKQMGMVGNNGTLDVAYDQSVRDRSAAAPTIDNTTAGLFRNGTRTGSSSYADFAQSLEQINSYDQGSAAGSYTVRSGETLQTIAQGLWGDADLWYKLAEANGLAAGAALVEGQLLRVPAGVTSNAHNAGTFTPYDAGQAMGDTMPTAAKPPKKPKCGVFGQILLQLIAYAVTSLLTGPLGNVFKTLGMGSKLAGAAGAIAASAVGSVVSQGVGVATGIQDKFSWGAVGMAAVSAGVGKGIGDIKVFGQGGVGKVLNRILTGAVREGVSQGIGVATGLQEKFSWAGVAAAGVSNIIPGDDLSKGKLTLARIGKAALRAGAKTLASAATRSLIDGTSFGDNIIAALPSVVSQMLWDGAMNEGDKPEASGRPPEPGTVNDTARKNGNGGAVTDAKAGQPRETVGQAAEDAIAAANASNKVAGAGGGSLLGWAAGVAQLPLPPEAQAVLANQDASVEQIADAAIVGADPEAPVLTISGKRMTWLQKAWFDLKTAFQSNPDRANTYVVYRAQAEIANAEIGARVSRPIRTGADYLYRGTLGPNTAIGRGIIQPINTLFYGAAGMIANSPLVDERTIMSFQSSGVPWGRLSGTAGASVRYLATVGGTLKVVPRVKMLKVAADPLAPAATSLAAETAAPLTRTYSGGAYGRLSAQAGVIERHHMPPNSLGFTTEYSGPAIQMDLADHVLTSSHSYNGLAGIAYRSEIQTLIDSGNMRGAMAREIWDVRRAAVQGGGSVSKYNSATREMLDYTYGKGWIAK